MLPVGCEPEGAAFPAPGSLASQGERCCGAFRRGNLQGVQQHPPSPGVLQGLDRVPGGGGSRPFVGLWHRWGRMRRQLRAGWDLLIFHPQVGDG